MSSFLDGHTEFNELIMKSIKLLTIEFKNKISSKEIMLFRGVIMNIAGKEHELFHNHKKNNKLRYSYPLIQYKIINDKPYLFCLDIGVDSSYHFFNNFQEGVFLGKRPYELIVKNIYFETKELQTLKKGGMYQMVNWLPLNQNNFKTFLKLDSEIDKLQYLEKILVGNILSFAKGIGWYITDKIEVRISVLNKQHNINIKGIKRIAFDITFLTNIKLPNNLSLGKNASIGYGTIKELNSN